MIGPRYLCKKNRVVFIIEPAPCRTPNVADLRKTGTTGGLTAINRARADGTECLRALELT